MKKMTAPSPKKLTLSKTTGKNPTALSVRSGIKAGKFKDDETPWSASIKAALIAGFKDDETPWDASRR